MGGEEWLSATNLFLDSTFLLASKETDANGFLALICLPSYRLVVTQRLEQMCSLLFLLSIQVAFLLGVPEVGNN